MSKWKPEAGNVGEAMRYLDELSEMRIELGLERVREVAGVMGLFGECSPKYVLISGTNGKGSTAYTLYKLLLAHGVKTGLYTSPHLRRITERVQVNGEEVSIEVLSGAVLEVKEAVEESGTHLTYFEVLTLAAYKIFERREMEVVVSEVGMGGRLDATNIAEPILSIITPISYDHQAYLGSTLREIAWEKAHILRGGGEAVISSFLSPYFFTDEKMRREGEESLKALFEAIKGISFSQNLHFLVPALRDGGEIKRIEFPFGGGGDGEMGEDGRKDDGRGVPGAGRGGGVDVKGIRTGSVEEIVFENEGGGRWTFEVCGESFPSPYLGGTLASSASTAVYSLKVLSDRLSFPVTSEGIRGGLRGLKWEGRGDVRRWRGRRVLLDGAHNLQAARALSHLIEEVGGGFHLIFACLNDKPCAQMLKELAPSVEAITVVNAPTPRTTPPMKILKEFLRGAEGEISITALGEGGLRETMEAVKGDILIAGSLYIVGEGLKLIEK